MKRHQPEKSGEWSCESGLCQHLPQMRKCRLYIQRRCKGLLDYQRRWCPEWITYGMVADAWGARVQTRQLRRYDK